MIDMTTPNALRTVMTIDAVHNEATVLRYSNQELLEVFGQSVVDNINGGHRAIWHPKSGSKNVVVFDVIQAAMAHNADLFKSFPRLIAS